MALAFDIPTASVALAGFGLSLYTLLGSRKLRLLVVAEFDGRPVGQLAHAYVFALKLTNTGQRPLTITDVWWESSDSAAKSFDPLPSSSGSHALPLKLEPDSYGELLFDPELSAEQLVQGVIAIRVNVAGTDERWRASVTSADLANAQAIIDDSQQDT